MSNAIFIANARFFAVKNIDFKLGDTAAYCTVQLQFNEVAQRNNGSVCEGDIVRFPSQLGLQHATTAATLRYEPWLNKVWKIYLASLKHLVY